MTRRRIASTMRWSCVAITTVVPVRLMRSSSRMMPTVVAGSRFPVGSSASRISGRFTNARAIDTRCCSPPDSSVGKLSDFLERPTRSRICGTCVRMMCFGRPITSSANGDVLVHGLVREQLVVLEHAADVAAQLPESSTRRGGRCRDRRRARVPSVATSSRSSSLSKRRLPRARRAHEEHELALGDIEGDIAEGDDRRPCRSC